MPYIDPMLNAACNRQPPDPEPTWIEALADLRHAVEFFDKVKAGTADEQVAVGTDHWEWLETAARRVAKMST